MKILFGHQHLGAMGGAESTLLLTARELRLRGHSISLLYKEKTGKAEEEWAAAFESCHQLAEPGNAEQLEALLDVIQPDLLFINNLQDLSALESLLDSGIPTVRMVHDHALYCMRQYKYNYFTRAICTRPASGWCVFPCLATIVRNRGGKLPVKLASFSEKMRELSLNKRCGALVVYSNYCRQELVRNGFKPESIHTFAPLPRTPQDMPVSSFDDRNLVLFAGQIIRGKGVDVLLRALKKVQVPFECVILGDGSHRRHCERLARRLGLTGKVSFKGYVAPDQMREYYLKASVFAVSSVWPEPFGLVGPEAMRYGLPVVAFDAGGIGEWLLNGQNGFLVPWMDTDSYANRIETLLQNKQLARNMGLSGRERVRREYDLSRQIARLESVFRGVCKDARPSAVSTSALNHNTASTIAETEFCRPQNAG